MSSGLWIMSAAIVLLVGLIVVVWLLERTKEQQEIDFLLEIEQRQRGVFERAALAGRAQAARPQRTGT